MFPIEGEVEFLLHILTCCTVSTYVCMNGIHIRCTAGMHVCTVRTYVTKAKNNENKKNLVGISRPNFCVSACLYDNFCSYGTRYVRYRTVLLVDRNFSLCSVILVDTFPVRMLKVKYISIIHQHSFPTIKKKKLDLERAIILSSSFM